MCKIIHRIYFDFDNKGDPFEKYLATWRKELPDYEIIFWNKNNLPLDLNDFVKYLHNNKMFSYLSDYFRCWLLLQYGGIYFDADIEVLKGKLFNSIYEDFLKSNKYDMLIGIESERNGKLTAHSMATKKNKNHPLLRFILELYEKYFSGPLLHIVKYFDLPSLMGLYFKEYFKNTNDGYFKGLKDITIVDRLCIYPQEYFSPVTRYDDNLCVTAYSSNTCICHHFSATWKRGVDMVLTFYENLLNNNYSIDPTLINKIKLDYPQLDININKSRMKWKLPKEYINNINDFFNILFPYGSIGFRLLRKLIKNGIRENNIITIEE